MAGTQMQLEDWLDDLCVRFIINLPQEDLSSVARICFQVEEAQWFYEDFIRPLDPTLPSMSLRTFCLRIFQHCPLLASFSVENHTKAFEEFLQYKTRVPVRGAIMLNQAMDSVVLVKGWKKGANWSFPRGKINKDEDDLDCAIREVYEETGLDIRAAGLVPTEKKPKYIEIAMREQQFRLYVFRDIPMDTNFQPRTRKEISKIQWYKLSELPAFRKKGAQSHNDSGAGSYANKFYMVAPFLVPLKKWIASQKKIDDKRAVGGANANVHPQFHPEEVATTEDDTWAPGRVGAPGLVPAIETLDGATRELQRLLKMQPPTQGLQSPPSHEDKGSALLSILQANSSRPQGAAQMPQTPLDLTVSEPSQPRNPHHHTNQNSVPLNQHAQEPPPVFHLVPTQVTSSWNLPQRHASGSRTVPKGAPDPPQQYYPANPQVPLAHPQPLPPQVQRAMFNKTTFQEGPPGAHHAGYTQHQQDKPQPNQVQNLPPQAHPAQKPGSLPLNGQSVALLNAFKRDTAPSSSYAQVNENGRSRGATADGHAVANLSSYASHAAPQGLPNLLDNSARRVSHQKSPSELAGSVVEAPSAQHRSALLGMFKKTGADTGLNQAQATRQQGPNEFAPADKSAKDERMLLLQLQSRGPGDQALLLDKLSLQSPTAQHGIPQANSRENVAPHTQPSGTARADAGGQPQTQARMQTARILQHGQTLNKERHALSPKSSSPYGLQAQALPGHVAGLLSTNPMLPHGESNRRPEAPRDQKRQLLSLFSKQQSPPGGMVQAGAEASGSGEQPFGTTSSTSFRRDTETPMSPADQSFLLEYLQTVTNNAAR
ncbi:mRNA decapping complex subunit 2 [Tolypocladium ophioglossoides CBS 100239]|uniref:mRNA decapping complex subunit 2 n=1 Tax=Tolypocladium ophioglossoides (strain CBS 100239) TaxID=1163406 RepID=A0A0L0NFU5_TOLOC|nr:mRNA decapping complex subunit 2 [Tolypocladium ophioglossoides CBS 100239]